MRINEHTISGAIFRLSVMDCGSIYFNLDMGPFSATAHDQDQELINLDNLIEAMVMDKADGPMPEFMGFKFRISSGNLMLFSGHGMAWLPYTEGDVAILMDIRRDWETERGRVKSQMEVA